MIQTGKKKIKYRKINIGSVIQSSKYPHINHVMIAV